MEAVRGFSRNEPGVSLASIVSGNPATGVCIAIAVAWEKVLNFLAAGETWSSRTWPGLDVDRV